MKKISLNFVFILPTVFCLVFLAVVVVLCVRAGSLSGKVEDLTDRLAQERAQSSSAVADFGKLKDENRRLREQVSSLTQQVRKLQTQSKTLEDRAGAKQETTGTGADGSGRVAYLTFDDGPSVYTPGLLRTLQGSGVHATFFVVGTNVVRYPDTVKQAYSQGNAVGIHCYDHTYAAVYASQNSFFSDFYQINHLLTGLIGAAPNVCRFPGGTGNTVSDRIGGPRFMRAVLPQVLGMGVVPFDWDVDAGDADARPASAQTVLRNVVGQAQRYSHPVILCHDTKKNTVEAIPSVVAALKSRGYSFGVLSPSVPKCRQDPT